MQKTEGLSAFHMFANSYEEALDMWFDAAIVALNRISASSLHEDFRDLRSVALEGVDGFIDTANNKVFMLMLEYINIATDYKIVRSVEVDVYFNKRANHFKIKASRDIDSLSVEAKSNIFVIDSYNKQSAVVDYNYKYSVLVKIRDLDWVKFVTDMKNGNHPLE